MFMIHFHQKGSNFLFARPVYKPHPCLSFFHLHLNIDESDTKILLAFTYNYKIISYVSLKC